MDPAIAEVVNVGRRYFRRCFGRDAGADRTLRVGGPTQRARRRVDLGQQLADRFGLAMDARIAGQRPTRQAEKAGAQQHRHLFRPERDRPSEPDLHGHLPKSGVEIAEEETLERASRTQRSRSLAGGQRVGFLIGARSWDERNPERSGASTLQTQLARIISRIFEGPGAFPVEGALERTPSRLPLSTRGAHRRNGPDRPRPSL